MCGIAGVIGLAEPIAQARAREAMRRLGHRGPDGEGWFVADDAVLAMRRLAIIDLTTGDQPIYNEERTVAVICNGELYDYVERFAELKQRGHRLQSASDVNVVPHLYEEAGRNAFRSIRGMFAIAVWDAAKHLLVLARDRAGKKPLFYARVANGLAFASELNALLALLDRPPAHSQEALAAYLQLGFVPHPDTIYRDVYALPPGCTLTFSPGGDPDIQPYWKPERPAPFQGSRADALDQLDTRLRESVALRLRSDVPIGMFLSGGIDSGLVASYARDLGARDLLCFVAEVHDPELNEGPAARVTAQHLDLPIETIPLQMAPLEAIERIPYLYGQPFGDFSAIPTFFVSRAARAHRKVVLNGDGGDEILGGYRRYWAARAAPWLLPLTAALRGPIGATGARLGLARERRGAGGFGARILRGLGTSDAHERYLIWSVDLLSNDDLQRCFPAIATRVTSLDRLESLRAEVITADDLHSAMLSDYRLILADGLLAKMDMATMANSLEARAPLLDVPLSEFAWSLPNRWLITPTRTKPLLRDLAARRLPAEIARAPKRGFEVPMRQWLETDLHDVVGDVLLSGDSRVAALGDRAALHALIARRDGFAGNYERVVWSLLMLELFLRGSMPVPVRD